MRAVVIDKPGSVELKEVQAAEPGPGEVRIRVALVGICATDVHILHGTFPTASYPLTPGHEVTGTIEAVGPEVDWLAVGDDVVMDPGVPCGVCRRCHEGRFNLCEHREAFGITLTGGDAELLVVPARNCYQVLPGTPPSAAVLAEPLSCVVHGFDLVRDPAGDDVLIYGGGAIGLLAAFVARDLGAGSVSIVELDETRAEIACSAGFAAAPRADDLEPDDWSLVVDATGVVPAISDGLTRLQRGGTFLQLGVAHPGAVVEVHPYTVFQRELTIVGSLTTRNSFPRALRMLARGAVDAALVTGEPFPVSRFAEAIESAGRGRVLKATVAPNAE